MPPETKQPTDYQNVISSEMDLKDNIRSGELDGYAIRDFIVRNTSFAEKHFTNVLIQKITAIGASFDEFEGKTLQLSQGDFCRASFRWAEFDELNMLNCQARECAFDQALLQNSSIFNTEMPNISFCNAKIVKTQFQDTNMYGAHFENAFIAQSQFTGSKNGQAELSRAMFKRAMILDSTLKDANLFAANFTDAILIRVDLRGANLAWADMRGAVLIDCKYYPDDMTNVQR
ncbi:MAG: pentapeptide repeat-containing protein [Proteobacteria bacterium]|nr:pentapeptide repeat-containing protein [Pseudomonadota bacterium]